MAQGISGTTDISGYFNNILEDAVFVARDNMIMPSLVTGYTAQGWADRKLSIYPQVSAASVGEEEDFSNPTVFGKSSLATLTPGEIAAQVILTDREIETDPQDARGNASRELGMAIADKIEDDLLGLFNDFTNNTGTAGSAFTLQQCGEAAAELRANNARGPFAFVLQPYHWLDIWKEIGKPSTSVVAQNAANAAMADYFVANLLNATWYQHANIDAGTAVYSAVFNREALALDMRRAPRMEPERDASKRAWELNITAGYATGVRRATFGEGLLGDATAP